MDPNLIFIIVLAMCVIWLCMAALSILALMVFVRDYLKRN